MKLDDLSYFYKLRYKLGYYKKKTLEFFEGITWKFKFGEDISKSRNFLNEYKGKFKGKRCFVIGNGPSLNEMDLNLMKNDFVFASNSFYLKFPDLNFCPQFISVEDHLVAEDNKKEFFELKGIKKFYPLDLRKTLKLDDEAFYINLKRAKISTSSNNFPPFSNLGENQFYWGGTVLYMNLQLAAHMGFSEIYLIGVDLTYSIPKDIVQEGSVLISQSDDPNHFDARYFGKGKRWHLPEVDRMQQSFTKAYEELAKLDIRLVNSTVEGNLKVIPRVDYNELF